MGAEVIVGLVLSLLDRMTAISALFQKTRAENREPSSAELAALDADYMSARQVLVDAIAQAKSEGR